MAKTSQCKLYFEHLFHTFSCRKKTWYEFFFAIIAVATLCANCTATDYFSLENAMIILLNKSSANIRYFDPDTIQLC